MAAYQDSLPVRLTPDQLRFLGEQLRGLTGMALPTEMPLEYAALLLGMTETMLPAYDCRGNKDFQHNPLFWTGRILEPVINQWLWGETNYSTEKGSQTRVSPLWPQDKTFAVCLTHDVDLISLDSLPGHWRYLQNNLRSWAGKRASTKSLLGDLWNFAEAAAKSWRNSGHGSLFDCWLELEETLGFRSTFFFFPDLASKYHVRDAPWYRHEDRLSLAGTRISVKELMLHLRERGWEVGLHGTFESFDNTEELKRQKDQIERSLGAEVVSIRQHCLHFDIGKTPIAQSRAGFKFDSTFGFNRIIGFRNGLAWPFYHYDLESDRPLPILQIPLHIQDGALLRSDNLDLTPALALQRAKELIDKVEQVRGLVTLLWHPNACVEEFFPGWFWVYQELLKYIAAKDAWVAPVGEIGAWWQQRLQGLRQWPIDSA